MAALLALVLLLALPLSAAAETFSTEDFMYQFGPTTSVDDPSWALAGVADPTTKLQTYQDMHGIAELITQDGETSILIMQKQTDTSESIFSLRDLSEEDKEEFLDGTMQSKSEDILVEKYYIDVNGQRGWTVPPRGWNITRCSTPPLSTATPWALTSTAGTRPSPRSRRTCCWGS